MDDIRKRIKRIKWKIKSSLLARLYINCNLDYRNTIFLAGSPRSGTTWLSALINYKNEYRYSLEPFHPRRVSLCKHFEEGQYLRPGNMDERYLAVARSIVTGAVRNAWIDKLNKKHIVHKRLVKDVWSNLMLKWIHEHFPEMPMILLLRHPCAVALSQFRGKERGKWRPHLAGFLSQQALIEDHLYPFRSEIEQARALPLFEQFVFRWCIENYVPLRQFSRGELQILFYEDLCKHPQETLTQLFLFLHKPFDEEVLAGTSIPSHATLKGSAIVTRGSLVDSWRPRLTDAEVRRSVEILRLFGLDGIYGDGPMPNTEGAQQMLAKN